MFVIGLPIGIKRNSFGGVLSVGLIVLKRFKLICQYCLIQLKDCNFGSYRPKHYSHWNRCPGRIFNYEVEK